MSIMMHENTSLKLTGVVSLLSIHRLVFVMVHTVLCEVRTDYTLRTFSSILITPKQCSIVSITLCHRRSMHLGTFKFYKNFIHIRQYFYFSQ